MVRQHPSVLRVGLSLVLAFVLAFPGSTFAQGEGNRGEGQTLTPIKHVIILIGENRTFDNIYATCAPKHGTVRNLLSLGIVNADGFR